MSIVIRKLQNTCFKLTVKINIVKSIFFQTPLVLNSEKPGPLGNYKWSSNMHVKKITRSVDKITQVSTPKILVLYYSRGHFFSSGV